MSISGSPKEIGEISFGLMDPEEYRNMSATKIITADTYDDDGFPIDMGLMDPRLGEMERDTVIGHGAAMTLKERLLDESDREDIYVCGQCGMSAVENVEQRRVYCPNCEEETDIHEVEMSYAFKLLLDEMKALGIAPRLELEDAV